MSDLKICHPLHHEGSTRIGRLVQALRPDAFKLDERSLQELIVSAHRYAQTLKYFDETNTQPEGAYWECFWEVEILTYLAVLSAKDTDEIRRRYEEADLRFTRELKAKPAPGAKKDQNAPSASYRPLLEHLRLLALSLEEAYQKLVRIEHPLQSLLLNRIRRDNCCDPDELEGALQRLIGYHKGADSGLPISAYSGFLHENRRWGLRGRVDYDAIAANPQFTQSDLRELFIIFYDTWLVLKNAAQTGFDTELARMELPEDVEYRIVQPHIVLFLVFLRLFRYAQDSLNELGERHLGYYYEEILGLRRRGEMPDEAYLLFELAKDVNQHQIKKGTEFLAGKDKNGQPLLFEAIEDWVLRPAKVADIKTTRIDLECGGIYGNPDVKKKYNTGTELPNESAKSWRGLGDNIQLPNGEVGFAIASPQLILREGKRVVDVVLTVEALPGDNFADAENFLAALSSEDAWILLTPDTSILPPNVPPSPSQPIPELTKGAFDIAVYNGNTIHIRAILERDDPPVVQLGAALAQAEPVETTWPVLKVWINPASRNPAQMYNRLRSLVISEIQIKVDVTGIRENLIIQSDQGVFDGTQKVFPFGPVPQEGNHFYLGSTEVFQKALSSLHIHFSWLDVPDSFSNYYSAYVSATSAGTDRDTIKTPDPYVQIGFIDRANIPSLIQVIRKELFFRKGEAILNFQILHGVVKETTKKGPTPLQNYTISTPGSISIVYKFIYPDGSGKFMVYYTFFNSGVPDKLEFTFKKTGDYEPLIVDLFRNIDSGRYLTNQLEVVLFPKQKRFSIFDRIVTGRISNIYGELIDITDAGIKIAADGINQDFIAPDSARNNYKFSINKIPTDLEYSIDSEDYKPLPKLNTNGFSIIDVIFYPNNKSTGSSETQEYFSGVLKKPGPDGAPIAGMAVHAQQVSGSGVRTLLTTLTDDNGLFLLPQTSAVDRLSFGTSDGWDRSGDNIDDLTNNNFEIETIPPLVQKTAPKGNLLTVKGKVLNFDGAAMPEVVVSVENDATTAAITDTAGQFTLPNIAPAAVLVFSKNGLSKKIHVDNHTFIQLYLPSFKRETSTNNSDDLIIFVKDLNDAGIPNVTIWAGSDKKGETNSDGKFTIANYSREKSIRLEHRYFNYSLGTVSTNSDQITITVVPDSVLEDAGDPDTLKGTVLDPRFQVVPNANVRVQKDAFIYETVTDNRGEFVISLPKDGTLNKAEWSLTVSKVINNQAFVTRVDAVKEKQVLCTALGRIEKTRPLEGVIRGTITQIGSQNNKPVKGALIKVAGLNLSAVTNEIGGFTLAGLPPEDKALTLSIIHPGYLPVPAIPIDDNSEIEVTLLPVSINRVFTGVLSDIYDNPLQGVELGIQTGDDTIFTGKSGTSGAYELSIPNGLTAGASAIFKHPGFQLLDVSLNAKPDVETEALSLMDLRLFFDNLNFFPLIENDTARVDFPVNIEGLNVARDHRTQEFDKYSPTLKRGFIRFTLRNGDFLHKEYPKVLTKYSINASKSNASASINGIPNPPYSPATNGISLDYSSTQVISGLQNLSLNGNPIDQFFHLLPFKGHKMLPLVAPDSTQEPAIQLIYAYLPDDTQPVRKNDVIQPFATGNLYIGIADLSPGGTLSLLIRTADGTEPDPEMTTPDIHWSYLAKDNTWMPFETGEILKDNTRGLTRSGMIQFGIPTTAAKGSTMLNPEYYWLRAATVEDGKLNKSLKALPDIEAIDAQVVQARFKNTGNELSHLEQPLPANTIVKMAFSNSAVKKVEQPLETFGGRLPESAGLEFYYRVSERLRHKDRAVTVWDYEHLTLERFPDVAAAKCIPHTRYAPPDKATELAPGFTTLALIPDLKKRKGEPWPEPRFTKGDLGDIRDFLASRSHLFVARIDEKGGPGETCYLQVVNPLYEKIDITVPVVFSGNDDAFHQQLLEKELTHFISPWLDDTASPPVFGRTLERSKILQFIEERAYVDYVELHGNDLFEITRDTAKQDCGESKGTSQIITGEKICPLTARSILVAGKITVKISEAGIKKPKTTSADSGAGNDTTSAAGKNQEDGPALIGAATEKKQIAKALQKTPALKTEPPAKPAATGKKTTPVKTEPTKSKAKTAPKKPAAKPKPEAKTKAKPAAKPKKSGKAKTNTPPKKKT
ncbi:MAG: hypothetical protein R3D58_00410 [Saprospiraceae bacterium]